MLIVTAALGLVIMTDVIMTDPIRFLDLRARDLVAPQNDARVIVQYYTRAIATRSINGNNSPRSFSFRAASW